MTDSIPISPAARVTPETIARKRRFWGWAAAAGLLLGVVPALVAVLGTVLVAAGVFTDLPAGVPRDPETLATEISAALSLSMKTLAVSFAALIFLFIAMLRRSSLDEALPGSS